MRGIEIERFPERADYQVSCSSGSIRWEETKDRSL